MAGKTLTIASYRGLFSSVKTTLTSGLIEAQRYLEYQRVKTYWTIGRVLIDASEESDGAIVLNKDLYQRLSADILRSLNLDLTADTIQRCVQFGRTYPVFPKKTKLTFTHYLALVRVDDPKERGRLEKSAAKEEWSSFELKERVRDMNALPELFTSNASALKVERGEPYIYFLRELEGMNGSVSQCVDCGFKVHIPLDGALRITSNIRAVNSSRYVCSVKTKSGYRVTLAARKRASVYTYKARILKVVDGDTLDALIDVGFGIRARERFRLKGINAPEAHTPVGEAAKEFLTKYLKRAPVVVVRTEKAGVYGRWLADVFILKGSADPFKIAAEGEYLNQVLLDKGYADQYQR